MKKLVLFLILIALLVPLGSSAETKYNEAKVLETFIKDLEAKIKEEDIIFNGLMLDKFIGQDEMEDLGESIKDKVELLGREVDPMLEQDLSGDYYTKEVIFEENFSQMCYIGQDKDKNKIAIILNSYINQEEGSGETYLYINIVKDSDFLKNNDIIDKIKSIYTLYGRKAEITSCIIGEISNDMSYNSRVKEIEKTLKKIDGNIVEEFADQSMISYTIFTPYIDNYIKIGKDRINLNLAIRNSEIDNKDYIWIGTPIITVGY